MIAAAVRVAMMIATVLKHEYAYQVDYKAHYRNYKETLVMNFWWFEHSLKDNHSFQIIVSKEIVIERILLSLFFFHISFTSTASVRMKKAINIKNTPLRKPAITSALT
jgi:hypothetical protein